MANNAKLLRRATVSLKMRILGYLNAYLGNISNKLLQLTWRILNISLDLDAIKNEHRK